MNTTAPHDDVHDDVHEAPTTSPDSMSFEDLDHPSDELSGAVFLGGDDDCETCGWSFNEVSWSLELEDGTVELRSSIGCYGGESLTTTSLDEASAFITDLGGHFPEVAAELDAEAQRLRTLLGPLLGDTTAPAPS